jgi:tetratricopeptide (TPR) repeat protein
MRWHFVLVASLLASFAVGAVQFGATAFQWDLRFVRQWTLAWLPAAMDIDGINDALKRAKEASDAYRVDEAVKLYTDVLESKLLSKEDRAKIYLARGVARFEYETSYGIRDAEVVLALRDFQKSRELVPDAQTYGQEGGALIALGAYDMATDAFSKAVELDTPKPYWSLIGLARVARIQKNFDVALSRLNILESLWRGDTGMPINYHRGWVLRLAGRHAEAVDAFTKGLPFQRDYAGAYHQRACAHAAMGKLTEALSDAEQAVKLTQTTSDEAWTKTPSGVSYRKDIESNLVLIKSLASGGDGDRTKLCFDSFNSGEELRTMTPLLGAAS